MAWLTRAEAAPGSEELSEDCEAMKPALTIYALVSTMGYLLYVSFWFKNYYNYY